MLSYIQVHQLKKTNKQVPTRRMSEHEVCSFYIISLIGKVSSLFPVPLDQNAHKAENQSQPYTPGWQNRKVGDSGSLVTSSGRNTSACPLAQVTSF